MPRVLNARGMNPDQLPPGAVYIGRRARGGWPATKWGNPFKLPKDGSRAEVIAMYRVWLCNQPGLVDAARRELRGCDLVCWCAPAACHGDVLLEIANA
jgi:Domain of unknown function (DUF4326)